MIPSEIERLLPKVQKPARYCGGEINTIIKDKSKVTTRVAFCFPDLYEVGMSHLGMKLFYSAFNKRAGAGFCPAGRSAQEPEGRLYRQRR